jgi:hypothetical protein
MRAPTNDEVATAHAATNPAELRLVQQRLDEARELLVVGLTGYEALRLQDGAAYALEPAALVADATGTGVDAARLLGAADGLRSEAGVPIWGPRFTRFETLKGSLRRRLGEEAFGIAWAEGQALGFDASLGAARRAVAESRTRRGDSASFRIVRLDSAGRTLLRPMRSAPRSGRTRKVHHERKDEPMKPTATTLVSVAGAAP